MKKVLIILIIAIAVSPPAAGNTMSAVRVIASKDEKLVRRQERRWVDALRHRNFKLLEEIMADDYVGTSSKGEVQNKSQSLTQLRADTPDFISFDTDQVEFHLYGDVAIVAGRERLAVLYENQEVSGQFFYTRVYVRRHRHWLLAVSHTSTIPH